jgi:hypothetical protein
VQRGAPQPAAASVALGTVHGSTTLGTSPPLPDTLAASTEREQLVAAVTNMALSQPPLAFADRFLFMTDMVAGGQGIVAFARGRDAGMRQFAIKCALCNPSGTKQAVGGT